LLGEKLEAVLSYWNALAHGNKLRLNGVTIPESFPKLLKKHISEKNPAVLPCPSSTGARRTPEQCQRGGARSPWRLAPFFKEGGEIFAFFEKGKKSKKVKK
jgi:hypothetical protein